MANATIRVQFGNPDGSGSDGHLSAEVDTRPDGLNGGRSRRRLGRPCTSA